MHLSYPKILLLLLSGLFVCPSFGQSSDAYLSYDSLTFLLQSDKLSEEERFNYLLLAVEKSPTEKVDSQLQLANNFVQNFNPSRSNEVSISKSVFHAEKGDAKMAVQLLEEQLLTIEDLLPVAGNKLYYQLAKNLRVTGESERAILMVDKAIEGAQKLGDERLIAISMVSKGVILNGNGNDEALDYYQKAKVALEKLGLKNELAEVINNIGKYYKQRSQYDTALRYYKEFLQLSSELDNESLLATAYNNIGTVHHSKGDLELALENYVSSLQIKEKLGNKRSLSFAYHNIGSIKLNLEDYKSAELEFKRSLDYCEEIGFQKLKGYNLMKIGNALLKQGEPAKAMDYHNQALNVAKNMNEKFLIMDTKLNLGEDLIALGEYSKAVNLLMQADKEAKEFGRKVTSGAALNLIAKAFSQSVNRKGLDNQPILIGNENTNKIEELLLESSEIAYEINNAVNIDNSLVALQSFYRQQSNYKREAFISNQLINHRDSLFSKAKAEALSMWETKYETAEKEKEILLLQKESEIQEAKAAVMLNRFIIGLVALLLLAGLGLMYFYYQHQIKRSRQMAAIRTKISSDLHDDVGSILSGLAMQTEVLALTAKDTDKPKLERIGEMSRSAMGRMRDTVWAIDSRKDKIENLLDRMREFAAETLTPKEFAYNFEIKNIDESKIIPADQRQNIYLIFKEAITNIIKHSNGDQVRIVFKNEGANFILKIADNGQAVEKNYKTTGLGTSNMERRANQLGGSLAFLKKEGFEVFYKGLAL